MADSTSRSRDLDKLLLRPGNIVGPNFEPGTEVNLFTDSSCCCISSWYFSLWISVLVNVVVAFLSLLPSFKVLRNSAYQSLCWSSHGREGVLQLFCYLMACCCLLWGVPRGFIFVLLFPRCSWGMIFASMQECWWWEQGVWAVNCWRTWLCRVSKTWMLSIWTVSRSRISIVSFSSGTVPISCRNKKVPISLLNSFVLLGCCAIELTNSLPCLS